MSKILVDRSLTGREYTFRGVTGYGHVTVPEFTAEVISSSWYFEYVNMVEVRVPGNGIMMVGVDRIVGLRDSFENA